MRQNGNIRYIRRTMFVYLTVGAAVLAVCAMALGRINSRKSMDKSNCGPGNGSDLVLYVGTYGDSLYRYLYSPDNDAFTVLGRAAAVNASYLCLLKRAGSPEGDGADIIYAVSENGGSSGAYSFTDNMEMTEKSFSAGTGADPCHIVARNCGDKTVVMTADYSGGSVTVFESENGILSPSPARQLHFEGSGPVAGRQESSHIHQLKFLPEEIMRNTGITGEWLLASDLGADLIRVLEFDGLPSYQEGKYADIQCGAGSGPRHMEFNIERNQLYCITELSGEVLVFDISSGMDGRPVFSLKQRILADMTNAGGSADIHLHPSGRYLYTSHRLQNDGIAVFSVSDTLSRTGYVQTPVHPRNFIVTPDGSRLLVACRDDKLVAVYSIDRDSGLPSRLESSLEFENDTPVCLQF